MTHFAYKTLLGLDIGTRHLGIAIGQTITQTASPLGSIAVRDGEPNWSDLDNILNQWQPDALVAGFPQKLNKKNHEICFFIKKLSEKIQERYAIPVHWVDEDLTTIEAKRVLFSKKGYRGLTKQNIDSYAAKLILEDWLKNPTYTHIPCIFKNIHP